MVETNSHKIELKPILEAAVKANASDIHLRPGLPAIFRVNGALGPFNKEEKLTPDQMEYIINSMLDKKQKEKFERKSEIDLAYGVPGLGRFRVNVFMQRSTKAIVLRRIPHEILTIEQLKLPAVIGKISQEHHGLILVTGTTGSGKTTTLAAMIDLINTNRSCHIVTIEDPIEILHRSKRSIVDQREVGIDTDSFGEALRSALRQDPNVILVGEMRDQITIETALRAADTGHLVLSTLHTLDATETISRIISEFPANQQKQIRLLLSTILKAVVSQRLVPTIDDQGRVVAAEIMITNERVRSYIKDETKTNNLREVIAEGKEHYKMQTFDQALMELYKKKVITLETALKECTNADNFKLKLSGVDSSEDSRTWGETAKDKDKDPEGGSSAPGSDDLEIERF